MSASVSKILFMTMSFTILILFIQAGIYCLKICHVYSYGFCIYYRFSLKLQMCLLQITGYKKLYLDVEELRKCPYNSDDEGHEQQLIKVKNVV